MLDAGGGGGGGAMYAVQIESLEEFQQKLTTILQSLEQDNATLRMSDGSSTFGDFPEAKSFSASYEQAKQDLINSFNEVTQLVNTMINVVGANANKYKQTEQDITTKFNSILQQYGDTPTTPTSTSGRGTGAGTTYYPQATDSGGPAGTTTSTNTGASTSTSTDTSTGTGTTYATQSSPSTTGGGNTSAGAA